MFNYKSDLVLSKSWLNRALIIQSYAQGPVPALNSDAEDVLVLKRALSEIPSNKEFYLGQGGTSFRFFCFLISRYPGNWVVKAHPRLLERPQSELSALLSQLGVATEFSSDRVTIRSSGWKIPDIINCAADESSQFVSALLLNCWNLDRPMNINITGKIVSEDYLKMTTLMLKSFGLEITGERTIQIPAKQTPIIQSCRPEVDMSSAFSLMAAAVVDGQAEITNWVSKSIQPDKIFLKLFDQMNIKYLESATSVKVEKQSNWGPISADLRGSPDLFPVLSVLAALARGTSNLYGAAQLKHKESDRLLKTKELLDMTGFSSELKSDGLIIFGQSSDKAKSEKVTFDPDNDHRMAMAAGVLKLAGFNIDILHPEVVNKSYVSFWKDVGLQK